MTVSTTPVLADLDFLGSRARVLAQGADTGGAFGLVDMIEVGAGEMPPLHVHHTHDEGFYVQSGEVTLFTPGDEITLRPGDFFLAPRGIPHTYRVGDSPAHWLIVSSPAGFESFVADVGARDPLGPEALTSLAAEHGIEILGPPGTMP
jgi:quercetin dioxygenase-like cupin family protein